MIIKKGGAFGLLLQFSLLLLTSAQSSTISSVDAELRHIQSVLVTKEVIIRQAISALQEKVDAAINVTVSAQIKTILQNSKDLLASLVTLSSYGPSKSTIDCNDVATKVNEVFFEIKFGYKTSYEVVRNNTLLFIQYGYLNAAYVGNYYILTNDQRYKIQAALTAMLIVYNEYNQYNIALTGAIYKYGLVYINLLFLKTNICSCPATLSNSSKTAMATIDSSLIKIQTSVDKEEQLIRNKTTEVITKINEISPEIKSNPTFILITTTLSSLSTLMKGVQTLKTTDMINTSLTCDDAALKLAFINYKVVQYGAVNFEIGGNVTAVLIQLNTLYGNCAVNTLTLTSTQKQKLEAVAKSVTELSDAFRQYLFTLCSSIANLLQLSVMSQLARYDSCNCTTGSANGTTIAGATTLSTSAVTTTTAASSIATTTTTTAATSSVSTTVSLANTQATTKAPPTNCGTSDEVLAVDGTYLNSVKLVQSPATYDDAVAYCKSIGMELYVLSTDQQNCIATFANAVAASGGALWVKGTSGGCTALTSTGSGYTPNDIPCSETTLFICEYIKDQATNCGTTDEILAADGTYIKSVEVSTEPLDYASAVASCIAQGRKLYEWSTDPQMCFSVYASTNGLDGMIWVDGGTQGCEGAVTGGEVWRKATGICTEAKNYACEFSTN